MAGELFSISQDSYSRLDSFRNFCSTKTETFYSEPTDIDKTVLEKSCHKQNKYLPSNTNLQHRYLYNKKQIL